MTSTLVLVLLLGAVWTVQGSVIDRMEQAQDEVTVVEDTDQDLFDEYDDDFPTEVDQYDLELAESDDDYRYDLGDDVLIDPDMAEVRPNLGRSWLPKVRGYCSGSSGKRFQCCVKAEFRGSKLQLCAKVEVKDGFIYAYINKRRIFKERLRGRTINIPIPKSWFGPAAFFVRKAEIKLTGIASGGKRVCAQIEVKIKYLGTRRYPRKAKCF